MARGARKEEGVKLILKFEERGKEAGVRKMVFRRNG